MTIDAPAGWLYPAQVMHQRRVPPLYRFVYRVFYLLLDIDRLDELDAGLRCFSHNRLNLLAFHDRDHGSREPGALRHWAEALLRDHGIGHDAAARIRLLCMPRLLGYAFNPISLWYCEDRDGRLRAVIAEVRNTFGERHCYLLRAPATDTQAQAWIAHKDKCFHVSPFFDLAGRYRFEIEAPGERLQLAIHETRQGVPILDTRLTGRRQALSDRHLMRQLLRTPGAMLKVTAGIHWEALKIWLRGGRYHTKPAPPSTRVS